MEYSDGTASNVYMNSKYSAPPVQYHNQALTPAQPMYPKYSSPALKIVDRVPTASKPMNSKYSPPPVPYEDLVPTTMMGQMRPEYSMSSVQMDPKYSPPPPPEYSGIVQETVDNFFPSQQDHRELPTVPSMKESKLQVLGTQSPDGEESGSSGFRFPNGAHENEGEPDKEMIDSMLPSQRKKKKQKQSGPEKLRDKRWKRMKERKEKRKRKMRKEKEEALTRALQQRSGAMASPSSLRLNKAHVIMGGFIMLFMILV